VKWTFGALIVDTVDLRRMSSRLFGNAYRLEVAAAIAQRQGKPVNVKTVAVEADLEYNRVQEQVAHLADAGLLVPDFDPASRYKDYRAVETVFWRLAADLLAEMRERDPLP
jgi:hypothetical protein